MKNLILMVTMVVLSAFFTDLSFGQDLAIFPAKGQTKEQMEKDKYDCYTWAKQETGFDPMQAQPPAQAPPAQPQGPKGERVKGAARGAAVGAVAGEIANDDAGKGAGAGAAAGAMVGGMKTRQNRRQQAKAQEQQAKQQDAALDQKRGAYDRAFSACMEGKGYTVK
ncbi:MAG: hypothetical protein QG552_594 [Thermodesulfobacteriota bacterium]|nr:hypothetical protein [Thermodesulfobacteriota bacterium]